MSPLQAIVLGLLQGLTEFLPVSSSGHLVLVPWLLAWDAPDLSYDVTVHVGTLVAVLIHFRVEVRQAIGGLWDILRERRIRGPNARLAWLLMLATLPGAMLGLLLEELFERLFATPPAVAALLIVTGCLLVLADRLAVRTRNLVDMRAPDALLIGLAQGAAIAPGISRSGATISAGLLRGLGRKEAGRFAFLLSIPIIAAAGAYSLIKVLAGGGGTPQLMPLVLGFVAAGLSGYAAIRLFLRFVRQHSLRPFAYYCWGLATLCLVVSLVR
ncbi:MAG: undecaprenyl-diphosphate phosphatase [Anaerolineae bacterium]|nr:undecaprenyl-diphosphate phosphatase [Anaerolineae bacterium]